MGFAGRKWGKMLMMPFTPFRGVSDARYGELDWGEGSEVPEMTKRLLRAPEGAVDRYQERVREALERQSRGAQ